MKQWSPAAGDATGQHVFKIKRTWPPSPTENEIYSVCDVELIIVAQSVAETEAPVIVNGDLINSKQGVIVYGHV